MRALLLLVALALLGCASTHSQPRDVTFQTLPGGTAKPGAGAKMTQFELQQIVQRFTSGFADSMLETGLTVVDEAEDPELQRQMLGRVTSYYSAALDVALGALPEVSVLDMLVFLRLSRSVIERHWKPKIFGDSIDPLLQTFRASEQKVWEFSKTLLKEKDRQTLIWLIDHWLELHPNTIHVEMVRFGQFAERAGEVSAEMSERAKGVVGSVRGATMVVGQGLLLGERAMFHASRLPTVIRLQTRLGAMEVIDDSLNNTKSITQALERLPDPDPVIRDLTALTSQSSALLRESQATIEALKPLLGDQGVGATIDSTNRLADKSLELVHEVKALKPADSPVLVTSVGSDFDRLVRRLVAYLALLVAVSSGIFWGAYYLVKRLLPVVTEARRSGSEGMGHRRIQS
jgi:hypothetical protein